MNTLFPRITCTTVAILALAFAAAVDPTGAQAQRQGPRASATGSSAVERTLRLADELDLTADQRTQLEAIRVELLEQRTARAVALLELRSEIAAGMREPEALREALSAQWRDGRDARDSQRDRVSEILTEDQREELQRMNRRASVRQRGPAHRDRIDRWRGPRGGGPFDRGRRTSRTRGGSL